VTDKRGEKNAPVTAPLQGMSTTALIARYSVGLAVHGTSEPGAIRGRAPHRKTAASSRPIDTAECDGPAARRLGLQGYSVPRRANV